MPLKINTKTPVIMGVLNITPDSFSDGGIYNSIEKAIERAFEMFEQGALILDIGAESSRPNSIAIDAVEEKNRLSIILPAIIKAFGQELSQQKLIISIDTYKPETMHWVLDQGVQMINDIHGFANQKTIDVIKQYDALLCLMHMQNQPHNMQNKPIYDNVVLEVHDFFCERLLKLYQNGIDLERLILDVGIGFGKTLAHNISLIQNLGQFKCLDFEAFLKRSLNLSLSFNNFNNIIEVNEIKKLQNYQFLNLLGISNKSIIGHLTNREIGERQIGNAALNLLGLQYGADILRVHDVAHAVDIIKIHQAFK